MGKILTFKRPWDGYEDMERLLREFYAARELEDEEFLAEAGEPSLRPLTLV